MADITGTNGNDTLSGTAGADTINGGPGNDTINGLGGDDRITGGPGDDTLRGGTGRDAFVFGSGSGSDRILDFSLGQDRIELNGLQLVHLETSLRRGEDTAMESLTNADWEDYGLAIPGLDDGRVFVRFDDGSTVTIDLNSYSGPPLELDLIGDIFVVTRLTGTSAHDRLNGTEGADTINGLGGNDWLTGGPGADRMDGGSGEDEASYFMSPAGVTIDLSATPDADGYVRGAGGDAEGDRLRNIESLWGSAHGDRLTGDDNDNILRGRDGDDMLFGGAGGDELWGSDGADTLFGGAGSDELWGSYGRDTLSGGPGADALDGGLGGDYASYQDSPRGVLVRLHDANAVRFGDAEGDTLTGIEHLIGSRYNDTLAGDGRNNILRGEDGDDTLYGGPAGGDDMMYGGNGDDQIFGGRGADELYGGAGSDVLRGGPGRDVLVADGHDMDILYGGPDEDTFRFFPSDLGGGVIRDFADGEDVIDLREFSGLSSVDDLDIVSYGSNVRIELEGADYLTSIILSDFNSANLDNSDFMF
ncbi:MAG: calcium-binding protein [Gammaproteobacteria bacterium]|nr:calcium-binding protein [Gammaproteobacteria bacterium]